MAYPTSHSSGHLSGQARITTGHAYTAPVHPHRPVTRASAEGEHQLEKLEFALAVALTRGDLHRSQELREAIAALGGNQEEPGT